MSPISIVRICSFAIVLALSSAYTDMGLYNAVVFFGLAHYILSAIYARKNVVAIARRPMQAASFIAVLGAGAWLYMSQMNLQLLFLPHHVFNEVYLTKKEVLGAPSNWATKSLTGAALVLNSLLYMQVLALPQLMGWFSLHESMPVLITVSTVVFAACLFRARKFIGSKRIVDAIAFELIAFAALFFTQFLPITFFQVVLYHFVFWTAYPLSSMLAQKDTSAARGYILVNAAAFAVLALIAPFSPLPWHIDAVLWSEAFLVGSFLHITTSLAVSRANPDWIWKFFLPAPNAVAAPVSIAAPSRLLEKVGSR